MSLKSFWEKDHQLLSSWNMLSLEYHQLIIILEGTAYCVSQLLVPTVGFSLWPGPKKSVMPLLAFSGTFLCSVVKKENTRDKKKKMVKIGYSKTNKNAEKGVLS